jgi:hypothetical protein
VQAEARESRESDSGGVGGREGARPGEGRRPA